MHLIIILLLSLETPMLYLKAIVKSPMRIVCLLKGHYWFWYGGGSIFETKYPAVCKRCGKFSKRSFESMQQNKIGQLHID